VINAEISIIPIGTSSSSVSEYVAAAVSELEASGLHVTLNATGTSVEADSPVVLFEALASAQEAVFRQGAGRAYTILKMDDRRDAEGRSREDMVHSVRDSQGQ
jgi:uncharacterized protein (TIGR00106 family)